MSEPRPYVRISPWLGGSVVTLLVCQLGLLWIQGSLLQRQREDILGLREDVQAMAETLEQSQDGWDANSADTQASPARHRPTRRRALVRVQQTEPEPERDPAAKELQDSRQSGRDAVAKARDTQEKLSISANIKKADEEAARVKGEGRRWRPWLSAAAALGVLAMIARAWLRRRD